jgi:Tfp pilus assembly protein PilV
MRPPSTKHQSNRGFTLLEALFASVVLAISVMAVISAITAAQQTSFDGQKRVLAAIAANDYMIELATLPYNQLVFEDNTFHAIGTMTTIDGTDYPNAFWPLSRSVTVTDTIIEDEVFLTQIQGLQLVVTCDDQFHEYARIELFVPDPEQ